MACDLPTVMCLVARLYCSFGLAPKKWVTVACRTTNRDFDVIP